MKAELTKLRVEINTTITISLNETEARALEAIFGYDVEPFLKVFYEKMGRAYVEPHEAGVRTLHDTVRSALAGPLSAIDETRRQINNCFKR